MGNGQTHPAQRRGRIAEFGRRTRGLDAPWPPFSTHWPVMVALGACLFLQRIGIRLGTLQVPIVVPIVASAVFVLLLRGQAAVARTALTQYCLFGICALVSAIFCNLVPPTGTTPSLNSLGYLLVMYAPLLVRIGPAFEPRGALTIFRSFVTVIAALGCAQFAAQFAGIELFSFKGIVPESLLLEDGYNVVIPLAYGSNVFKSNGVFLLEPSIFSQFAALGLAVELLYFGSPKRMALLAMAMVTAFSGTGILVLACAVIVAMVVERRSFRRLLRFGIVGGIVLASFTALASPEYVDSFAKRAGELDSEQSSGFVRFVSPYAMLAELGPDPRFLVGFGPGTAERFDSLGYAHGVNALTKMLIEYGVFGLVAYALLLLALFFKRDRLALSLIGLFWFVFGGGYHLTPAVLYSLASLLAWPPRLQPSRAAPSGDESLAAHVAYQGALKTLR